jgi:hypothetical protein
VSVLLQTLYAVSRDTPSILAYPAGGEDYANTPAGTHDGSDTTRDEAHATTVTDGTVNHSVAYAVDACTVAGTIDFVRAVSRCKAVGATDGSGLSLATDDGGDYSNAIGPSGTPGASYSDVWFDAEGVFDGDANFVSAWTASLINARHFGVAISGGRSVAGTVTVSGSEFRLEVWGPAPQSAAVGAGGSGSAGEVSARSASATAGSAGSSAAGLVAVPAVAPNAGAGSTSGASITVPRVIAYRPDLVVPLTGPIEIDGTTFAPLTIPQTLYRRSAYQLRALGQRNFAFAQDGTIRAYGGARKHSAYVVFSLPRLPAMGADPNLPNWIFSFHEPDSGGREILSIGVTPLGSLAVGTPGDPVLLTPTNTAPRDGAFHEARAEFAPAGGWRALYLDGTCIVSEINPLGDEYAIPEAGVAGRVALFNGRDADSMIDCFTARAGLELDEFHIDWPLNEGSGGTLASEEGYDTIPTVVRRLGSGNLVATWWDGNPRSTSPNDPALPVTSAYSWKYSTPYIIRRPAAVAYRKVPTS